MIEPLVYQGDCLEVMRSMPDNSVDACVTDPPYGLGQVRDIAGLLTEWMAGRDGDDHVGGSGFMGRAWDKSVPGPRMWRELLRVLKPGAYALVFAGSRTSDLMGLSLRLAGFELVDSIFWCFGAGFPKGADVGKMLDKVAGVEREVVATIRKTPIGGGKDTNPGYKRPGQTGKTTQDITALATEAACEWDGYRSQLKPAHEPILVCRKPLDGTIAQNALKWGTGAFNIDGCRVDYGSESIDFDLVKNGNIYGGKGIYGKCETKEIPPLYKPAGRYPANLILQHAHDCDGSVCGESCPVRLMGEQSGGWDKTPTPSYSDTGTAARYFTQVSPDPFFYMGKATKKDRTCDGTVTNTHPTVKPRALIKHLVTLIMPPSPDAVVIDPFGGSGTTAIAAKELGRNVILIEREPEYIEIIHARLNATAEPDKPQQPAQLSLLQPHQDEESLDKPNS